MADGFEIETQMNLRVLRAGFKVAEVPSFEADRIHGREQSQDDSRWLASAQDDDQRAIPSNPQFQRSARQSDR